VSPESASAGHGGPPINWTYEDYYSCTLVENGTCFKGVRHSYAFNSAKNQQTTNRTVCSLLEDSHSGYLDCRTNFVRLCYPPWGVDMNCHDRDTGAFRVGVLNAGPSSAVVQGHALW
jgi:hypothetical protein